MEGGDNLSNCCWQPGNPRCTGWWEDPSRGEVPQPGLEGAWGRVAWRGCTPELPPGSGLGWSGPGPTPTGRSLPTRSSGWNRSCGPLPATSVRQANRPPCDIV